MWSSIFILFLSVGGSFAFGLFEHCDGSKCEHLPVSWIFAQLKGLPPTAEQLPIVCPFILRRFECEDEAIKDCTGKNLRELTLSDNVTVATYSNLILSIESIFTDICDEDSILHQGYVSTIDCQIDMIKNPNRECRVEGLAFYSAYKESMKLIREGENPEAETDPEAVEDERECLSIAYTVACSSIKVQETCGAVARATFVEVLKRIQFLKLGDCSEEDIVALKTTFLDFMELEAEKRSLFFEVFNSKK